MVGCLPPQTSPTGKSFEEDKMKVIPFRGRDDVLPQLQTLLVDEASLTPRQELELRHLISRINDARAIFQEVSERIALLKDEILAPAGADR